MKTFQFKTNIHCGNCIKSVTPFLNQEFNIDSWKVDTEHPDKILTVEGENDLTPGMVEEKVKQAGFEIALL